jgi:subtilase family serine protease/CubicO group peptidase (beta-lactamase class C family)
MILRFSYALLLLCSTVFYANAQSGLSLPDAKACDETIQSFLEEQGTPGLSIAIAKDGRLFYSRGFGVVDEATKEPVQPYHRFRIAGLSKTITAVAVMKLIEEGKLSLDDKVFGDEGLFKKGLLLEFDITDDRVFDITVGQLLMHSAGWDAGEDCLPHSEEGCDPVFIPLKVTETIGGSNPANKISMIGFALEQGLQFDPGTDFAYSNVGYLILEQVIARASGMSYSRFVKQYLMDPLGLCDLSIGQTLAEGRQEREASYQTDQEALSAFGTGETVSAAYGQFNLPALTASNGIISSAEELLRFILAIDGFGSVPDILNAASIEVLTSASSANPTYAKGLQIDGAGNWWHQGVLPGSSAVWGRTADGYAWVALFNEDDLLESEVGPFANPYNELILNCIDQLGKNFKAMPDLWVRPVQATSELQALVVKETSLVLSWLPGEGESRLILMKAGSPVDAYPEDGQAYELSDELGEGNVVVYNGNGAALNLKELDPNTNYHFRIFEYNEVKIGKGQYKQGVPVYRVACSNTASFTTLPLAGDCKCLSNRMEDICEDFESFSAFAPVGLQSNCWTTSFGLEGTNIDALISSEKAFDGNQSLLINGTGEQNLLFTLSDRKKGQYRVQWRMLIPKDKKAAFAVQSSQGDPDNPGLSVQLSKGKVNSPMLGDPNGENIVPEDEWFTVSQVFDLDNNSLDLMIGEEVIVSDFNYEGNLGGVSFFSEDQNSRFFVDALEVENIGQLNLDGPIPNLTCASTGTLTIDGNIILIEDLEVINNGDGPAAGSSIGFFISDNTSFTTLDTYIGENFINGLDPQESIQITFGADISALNLPPGEYFIGFIVDYKNVVQEINEEDNNDCFFQQPKLIILPPPKPDLTFLGKGSLTLDNNIANIENLEVANIGGADSDSTTLAFYLTPNDNVTVFDIELGSIKLDTIPAGNSVIVNFSRDLDELDIADDDYKLGVIVDYTEEQEEEEEDNNSYLYPQPIITFPLGEPNLTCDSLGSLTITGPIIDIDEVRVANNGEVQAGSHKIGIFLSTNTNFTTFDQQIGEIEVDSLPAGATLTFSTQIDLSGLDISDGTYFVGFIFDYEEVIEESDESDNNDCYFDSPTITFPLLPNLRCDSLGTLTITETVVDIQDLKIVNDGDAGAGSHQIGIYLSTDTTITAADSLIGEITVDTLPRNGTLTLTATIDVQGLDIPEGIYFIGILLDRSEEVTELSEEDNDCYYEGRSLTIGAPNLTCADVGTLTITDGLIDIQDLKVTNNGGIGAGSHVIGVYLSNNINFTDFDVLIGEINVDTLAAGDTLGVSFARDVSEEDIADGTYFVGFILDKDDEVVEADEDDNDDCFFNDPTITFPFLPNLRCDSLGTLILDDLVVDIQDLKIVNDGDRGAGSHSIGIYLSTDTTITAADSLIREIAVDTLPRNGTLTVSATIDVQGLAIPDGIYFIGILVDKDGEVTEVSEEDNDCYYEGTRLTFGAPNLTCGEVGTLTITDGLIDITDLKITNNGFLGAGSHSVGVYLSTNTNFTSFDVQIGTINVDTLAAGDTLTTSFSTDISAADIDDGTYFVGFIIDQDDEVAESDEDDNNDCFFNEPTITFPLVGDPNLSCNNSGTLTVESGLVTIADLEILNSGDGPAGASFIGVYLSTNTTFTEQDEFILEVYVDPLEAGASDTLTFRVDVDTLPIPAGEYFVGYIIDYKDDVAEINEDDNADCYFETPKVIIETPRPNLTCESLGTLTVSESLQLEIDDFQMINDGDGNAGPSRVGFYLSLDTDFTTDDIRIGDAFFSGVDSEEVFTIDFSSDLTTLGLDPGTYYVGFILDYEGTVEEINEEDNTCFYDQPQVVISVEGDPNLTCGDKGTLTIGSDDILNLEDIQVTNNGEAPAGASTLAVYLSSNINITSFDELILEVPIGALQPGETDTVDGQVDLKTLNISPGEYFVGLFVDNDDVVAESDEGDNNDCFFMTPKVSFPLVGEPNLSCQDPGTLSIDGTEISITDLEVINNGNEDVGAYEIGFYLSTDDDFTTDDIFIGSLDVGGTDAGQTVQASFLTNINPGTIPDGTYMVGFIIDYLSEIEEEIESDNICGFKTPTITLPLLKLPDLVCKYRGDLYVDDWDIFIRNIEIKNMGDAPSGATEVCIVLSEDKNFTSDDRIIEKLSLPALAPGEVAELNASIELMNLDVPFGEYYVGLIIDCEDKVDEADDIFNNICYWETIIKLEDTGKPDLTCKEIGTIYCDDWDIFLKDIWIQNIGKKASEATTVCVYLSEDDDFTDEDNILIKTADLPGLEMNGTAELNVNIELMSLNVPYGTYYVALVIDCEDLVMEADEDNNICIYDKQITLEAPKQPDLTCKYLGDFNLGGTGAIGNTLLTIEDVIIINNGEAKSDATKVGFYLSENDRITTADLFLGDLDIPMLEPDAVADLDFQVDLEVLDVPFGSYYIGVIIDYEENIPESDEQNNVCFFDEKLKFEGPQEPDLSCMDLGKLTIDENLKLAIRDLKVINIGNAKSDQSRVGIYLSANTIFTNADFFIGSIPLKMLEPGQAAWLDFDAMLQGMDIPTGTYYVGAVIDDENAVSESDEQNNICYYNTPKVTIDNKKPDLTCKETGTMTYDDWDIYIEDAWIQNIGDGPSEATKVCIYLSEDDDFTDGDNYYVDYMELEALEPGETAGLSDIIELVNLKGIVPFGTYYIALVIDCENEVMESNEDNNICVFDKTITLEKPAKPDLTCKETGTMTYDDWDIYIEDAWIQNIGDGPSEATKVCIYLSEDDDFTDGDNYYVDYMELEALEPGETAGLSDIIELVNLKGIVPFGTYYIALVIDCENEVIESNEDNNICVFDKTITLTKPKPDLTCKENGMITCDDWDIYIEDLWIQNIGDGPSEATSLCLYLSPTALFEDDDNYLVEVFDLPALEPGESVGITEIIELANLKNIVPFGTYYIGWIIDCEDKVMESDEYNNFCIYDKTITLKAPPKPDLTCLENGTITCDDWDIFIEDAWIKNIGDTTSAPTSVCLYLSPDPDFNDNDNYLVETFELDSLQAGETAGITEIIELANLKGIVPFGTYYIALVIDCEDLVMESDEDNNICKYHKTITLKEPKKADLMCKEPGFMKVRDQELKIWDVWVGNMGVGASVKTDACFYLSKDPDFTDENNYLIATVDLEAIEPFGTGALNVTVDLLQFAYEIPYGEYYLAVVLDCSDKVLETNEDNNICTYDKKVTIVKPPLPDLVCMDVGRIKMDSIPSGTIDNVVVFKKDTLLLSIDDYQAGNLGEIAAAATTVGVYISVDDHFGDEDDIFVDSMSLGGLNPGYTSTLDAQMVMSTKDLPAGAYYIGYVVDNQNKIYESDEDNNQCTAITKLYHLIEAPLECACYEATEENLCESFELYQAETWLDPQADCWTPYVSHYDQGNSAIDAMVRSYIGVDSSQGLRIDQEGQNMVLTAPNYTLGIYRTSWMMKIPEDSSAYVSILNSEVELTYEPTKPIQGLQFTFGYNTPGKGKIIETGEAFDYPEGEWFEVEVVFDFRFFSQTYSIKVDSVEASGISLYAGKSKIGAMNFAALDGLHNFIVDNIQIEKLDAIPQKEDVAGGGQSGNGNTGGYGNGNNGGYGNGQNNNNGSGSFGGYGAGSWGLNSNPSTSPDETADTQAGALSSGELSEGFKRTTALKQYTIYPNPTSGQFRIDLSLHSAQDVEVFILNSMGQVVRRVQFDRVSGIQESIDLSDQPSGLYLIRTQVGEVFYNNRLLLER